MAPFNQKLFLRFFWINKYPTFLLKEVQEIMATKGWLSKTGRGYNIAHEVTFSSQGSGVRGQGQGSQVV